MAETITEPTSLSVHDHFPSHSRVLQIEGLFSSPGAILSSSQVPIKFYFPGLFVVCHMQFFFQ